MTEFRRMWKTQYETMLRMEQIELENGILEISGVLPPAYLETIKGQAKLRRIAWQITEEVAEVLEAEPVDAQIKEVADVLHFLVELLIVAGVDLDGGPYDLLEVAFEKTVLPYGDPKKHWAHLVHELGKAMFFLKNRPWKQALVPTDVVGFRKALQNLLFYDFVVACQSMNIYPATLYDYYFRKNETNKQRVEEGV